MLARFQTNLKELSLLQSSWTAVLDPLVANPANSGLILKSVVLKTGVNTVNHLLGQKLQGWQIVRQRAAAMIFDKQDGNQHPDLTLMLVSSAPVTVDILVF